MTETQRKYDDDLISAMNRMANWIEPRSHRVSHTLRLGAERLRALAYGEPRDVQPKTLPLPPDDMRDGDLPKQRDPEQPASTPVRKRRRIKRMR